MSQIKMLVLMTSITRAETEDYKLLAEIGKTTYIESHGNSASEEDINIYVKEKYTEHVFREELSDADNIYHILYYNNKPAGYSKIIYDASHPNIEYRNVTKLERLYLLKEFYKLKLGSELMQF